MTQRISGVLCMALVCAACGDDAASDDDPAPDAAGEPLACEVAVVGGGAGGLHTAFRLAAELGAGVCLFEREDELGGRIKDVALDEDDPDSPRFGTGALRVMEGQEVLFGLAEELSIELETPNLEADLISARGGFAFSKQDLVSLYPNMAAPDPGDHETALYEALMDGPNRAEIATYPDFRAYVQDSVGVEEYHFLRDMSRFRADFEYPLDARGYMDYFDEEWDVCCTPSYPVGGMSMFIRGMEAEARADGAQIFTGETVTSIARAGDAYRLITSAHVVTANRVVIAIPPTALDWVEGDVVEEIRAQPAYQDLIGVKVATVTQWWPSRWWDDVVNPDAAAPDNNVWRAWTTEHCFNFIEIPLGDYGRDQMVTRSVYDDDLNCVLFWEELAAQGTDAVEAEIARGLAYMFSGNGVTEPATVTIPEPIKTHVQIWPAGWWWLRAGASVTNAEVFAWAVEPIAGEEVALVGEAYNPNRSGWSDGAYKSSINLLNTKYGMDLPGLARPASPRERGDLLDRRGRAARGR